ncbi:MAG: alpha/beta fold hydrolase [Anaerolineae bacterium]
MSEIFYQTYGHGEIPVLMIHGWASSHIMWRSVYPHLHNATCTALDLPGFGRSPVGDSTLTIDAHVETVLQFIEQHGTPQMIIAHSMGGLITLEALRQHPEIAQQLVLICPVVTGKFGLLGGIPSEIIRFDFAQQALRATQNLWTMIQNQYLLNVTVPLIHTNPQLADQVKQNFLATDAQAGIEALISMTRHNTVPHLPQITQDTLICASEGDTTVPYSEACTASRHMPNAEIAVFQQSRHHPMDEESELFVPILRAFVSRFGL